MSQEFFQKLLEKSIRKFVFLGGPGSGKSELALHYALAFAGLGEANVNFFDMDQSKPLFRSRDVKEYLIDRNIRFHSGEKLLDAPVVPKAVVSTLSDPQNIVIFDVGGGPAGASNIGQYSRFLDSPDTVAYFVINYFRPFSRTTRQIEETLYTVLRAASIKDVQIINNPFYGPSGGIGEFNAGYVKIVEILAELGMSAEIVAFPESLWGDCPDGFDKHILKIKPCINLVS